MDARVRFDNSVGETFLRFARLVAGRGHVRNTLGNMARREQVFHPERAEDVMREGDEET